MAIDNKLKEDQTIIQPDNTRACYNYETPQWNIINPQELCLWKETYQKNQEGKGTSFIKKQEIPCAECDGYDKKCEKYYNLNE